MRTIFYCSIKQANGQALWTRVQAENTRIAARNAVEQTQAKGRCTIDIYRGDAFPENMESAPVASETMIA